MAMDKQAKSDVERLELLDRYLEETEASATGKSDKWHIRRFCQEDWLLNIRVYRVRDRQWYEIGLFLAEDHWKFQKDSGVMGGLVFALSEAYHHTGRMEIHFVGPAAGGDEPEIPYSICRVAKEKYGVTFQDPHRRMISDAEGRQLYEKITGFSEEVLNILDQRGISRERVCFVVHRGIWSKEQIEFIARHAWSPERIFRGGAPAEHRLSFQGDLVLLRIALLAERARLMLESLTDQAEAGVQMEWKGTTGIAFRVPCDVTVDVLDGTRVTLPGQETAYAFLVPRDAAGYRWDGHDDLPPTPPPLESPFLVFMTRDIQSDASVRDRLLGAAKERNVIFVPIVDTLAELDTEIGRRLARAASTKREMPERPD